LITFSSFALAGEEKVINTSGLSYMQLPDDVNMRTGLPKDELDTAFRVGVSTSKVQLEEGLIGISHFTEIFYSNFSFDRASGEKFTFQSLGLDFGYGLVMNVYEDVYFHILPFLGGGIMFAELEKVGSSSDSKTAVFGEYGVKVSLNTVTPDGFLLGVFGGYLNSQTQSFSKGPIKSDFALITSGSFIGVSIGRSF